MKKKFLLGSIVMVITVVATYNVTKSVDSKVFSIDRLTNIEALASESSKGPYQTMSYCGGSKIKLTCTYDPTANACTHDEC